jgi:hypothetical protein
MFDGNIPNMPNNTLGDDDTGLEATLLRGAVFAHEAIIEAMLAAHPSPNYVKAILTSRFSPENYPESIRGVYAMNYEKYLWILDKRLQELGGQ